MFEGKFVDFQDEYMISENDVFRYCKGNEDVLYIYLVFLTTSVMAVCYNLNRVSFFILFLDQRYWTHAYQMPDTDKIKHRIPVFLMDLAKDVFLCGKTINLLKLCCPEVL